MSPAHVILIVFAGFAAGAINSVVGSGTLITFLTLVTLGLHPVVATMSNAVGIVLGGVTGTWVYRAELAGQWRRLRWQIPALVAGAEIGAFPLFPEGCRGLREPRRPKSRACSREGEQFRRDGRGRGECHL